MSLPRTSNSASSSSHLDVSPIAVERDRDVRQTKVYLASKPLEWQLPAYLTGHTYEHWGLFFVFFDHNEETGQRDVTTRFVELTVRDANDADVRSKFDPDGGLITFNYGTLLPEYERKFRVIDQLPDDTFVQLSPKMIFDAAHSHAHNGTVYRVGSNNCQDWVMKLVMLRLDASIVRLSELFLHSIVADLAQDISAKKLRKGKSNPFANALMQS